jgi:hypothetical protein
LGWYYSKETAIREMKYFETFKYLPNEFWLKGAGSTLCCPSELAKGNS